MSISANGRSCRRSIRRCLTAACAEAESWMLGKYDTDNVAAMRRLIANGTQLRPFSREILDACYKATQEFYAENSANNPKWKAIYEPWKKFLDDEHQWFRVAEQQFRQLHAVEDMTLNRGQWLRPLGYLNCTCGISLRRRSAAPRSGSCSDRPWGRCRARRAPCRETR